MKKKETTKAFDQEIKRRVQALEWEIPRELESAVLKKIEGIIPLTPEVPGSLRLRHRWLYYGALATAATILLAVLLFLYPLFNSRINTAEAGEVWVQSAHVEGCPAGIVVVNPKESGITVVWIEKIENKIDNKNGGV